MLFSNMTDNLNRRKGKKLIQKLVAVSRIRLVYFEYPVNAIEIIERSDLLASHQLEETSVEYSPTGTLAFLESVER